MDTQTMFELGQRISRAPNNEARVHELMALASDATLARFGLAHRSSAFEKVLWLAGAATAGAVLGAGAALLLTPMSGEELQTRIQVQAKRLTRETKKKARELAERVAPEKQDHVGTLHTSSGSIGHPTA